MSVELGCPTGFTSGRRRTYLPSLLAEVGFSPSQLFALIGLAIGVDMVLLVLAGALSDRIGRRVTCIAGAIYMIVLRWPLLAMISSGVLWQAALGSVLLAVGVALVVGPPAAFFVEIVPARTRMTTFGIAYNVGAVVFGGPAVLVETSHRLLT